jgi:acyl dehydratase
MKLGTLAAGSTLPEHRVSARMPAEATENKIHEDSVARDFGFRGALVPGVTLYAWMTHPVVALLGLDWLASGTFAARFAKPVYFGEPMTVHASVTALEEDAVTIEARVVNAAGVVCATATMGLAPHARAPIPDVSSYPAAPLPEERPRVSREVLAARPVLGTPTLALDRETAAAFLDRVSEPLPLYAGPGAPAHPGLYLAEANRALSRNVMVSPWIHVESEGRHLGMFRVGEQLETRARVNNLFERKGHQLVELDVLLVAEGARPVARIRHVAIYQLRGAGG